MSKKDAAEEVRILRNVIILIALLVLFGIAYVVQRSNY